MSAFANIGATGRPASSQSLSRCEICLTPKERPEHLVCASCWRWHQKGTALGQFVERTRGNK